MGERPENRIDRIVSALLRGRRLKLRGGDAEEKEAVIMAARLAAARQGPQRMSPAFRHRLEKQLEGAIPPETGVTRRAPLGAGPGGGGGGGGGGGPGGGGGGGGEPTPPASGQGAGNPKRDRG